MESTRRNQIFMDHMDMIERMMHKNYTLLRALHLDYDDVYQDLAITALQAIESFDPSRSSSIETHIWMKMQYAVLDLKKRFKPCGIVAFDAHQPIHSIEFAEERGYAVQAPTTSGEDSDAQRLRKAMARLDPEEREAVLNYLEGTQKRKCSQKETFQSALDKLRDYYMATHVVMGVSV